MIRFLQYIRWLSLGIPTGAIFVLALVVRETSLVIPTPTYLALFSAVWFIYLFDHWWDIRRIQVKTCRRQFHQNYKPLLIALMILCVLMGVYAISSIYPPGLRMIIVSRGLLLASVCGGYLFTSQWLGRRWLKEVSVAFNYALGIMIVPLILVGDTELWVMTIQIFMLALLNLITFSVFEVSEDMDEGFHSIATRLGTKTCARISSFILLVLWSSLLFMELPVAFEMFIAFGGLTYAVMYAFPHFFASGERFRIVGDAVFMCSIVFLLPV